MNNGKSLEGQIAGMSVLKDLGGLEFDLTKSKHVEIYSKDEKAGVVHYKIVAKRGNEIVAETVHRFFFFWMHELADAHGGLASTN